MTRLDFVRSALSLASIMLMGALFVGHAGAQDVDAKGDKELKSLTQRIDKSAADRDAGRVTARIVDEWKGTPAKFDAKGAPRVLTAQDVQNLRAKGLGFGEISILLALTAKQSGATTAAAPAKSLDQILAMRQAHEGWGKIAKDLGYKNLGSVISSVKATEKSVTRVALERREKVEKPSKMDRPEKMEKPEKPEKMERPERPEKPGR